MAPHAGTLFDDVTIHTYRPWNSSITQYPPVYWRSVTLAVSEPLVAYHLSIVRTHIGPNVRLWLDELNWGGFWEQPGTWLNETDGALRGMHLASFVLAAIQAAPAVDTVNWYSLFYQANVSWTYWASVAKVSNAADAPQLVQLNGVAQIFADLAYVALGLNMTTMAGAAGLSTATLPITVLDTAQLPCLLAARFSGPAAEALVALNRCPTPVTVSPAALPASPATSWAYSAYDAGGWVPLTSIPDPLANPWWNNGPLVPSPLCSANLTTCTQLPALSLAFFVHHQA